MGWSSASAYLHSVKECNELGSCSFSRSVHSIASGLSHMLPVELCQTLLLAACEPVAPLPPESLVRFIALPLEVVHSARKATLTGL